MKNFVTCESRLLPINRHPSANGTNVTFFGNFGADFPRKPILRKFDDVDFLRQNSCFALFDLRNHNTIICYKTVKSIL